MRKDKAAKSIVSKLAESASLQFINFIVGIILARILSPSDYGIYSILLIFINIGQTVIVGGFNSALIQRKKIDEEDFSTVLVFSFIASVIVYGVLFFSAPIISSLYHSPEVIWPLRVVSLVLFPDALYSLVNARIARKMEFVFAAKLSVVAVVITGGIGILLALKGAGVWALVVQQILTYTILPITYCLYTRWFPKFRFRREKFRPLFGFGSKILLTDLINAIYSNIQGMIIGIKYNTDSLAFFNKGQMFPRTVMTTINESIQTVLFPVYADIQEDKKKMADMLLHNMEIVSFIVFPMMMGLFATSNEIVILLLTEKWIGCAYIIKVFCVAYMFWPIDSMNLQAIKASGKGKTYLGLNLIKKTCAALILFMAVMFSDSVETFAISAVLIYVSDITINSFAMKKIINVNLWKEIKALWKSIVCSVSVLLIIFLPNISSLLIITLVVKILVGISIYIAISILINRECVVKTWEQIMHILKP